MTWGGSNNRRRVRTAARPSYGRPTAAPKPSTRVAVTINARAIAAVIVLVLVVGWWWQFFKVSRITVEGAVRYPTSSVSQAAQAAIGRHWWWHNLTTLDTRALRHQLLASQAQLADVAILRRWPSRLDLVVTERQPNLIWSTKGQSYLLDGQGTIIAPVGNLQTGLMMVTDTTNLPVKVGERVVPSSFVTFCTTLLTQVPKQTGLKISGFQVPETTSEVYLNTTAGYYIKFDTTRDAGAEIGDLVRVLAQFKTENKSPTQYIDLRVENRAYYK